VFPYPKPVGLLRRVLELATDKDSLVLDSFAGSGTTGHAVMKLNAADGGHRRFVLIEMEEAIARNITAERLKRVLPTLVASASPPMSVDTPATPLLDGASPERKSPDLPPVVHAPGFQFCTLGDPLFDENGHINAPVRFCDLARHIFFSETGRAPDKAPSRKSPLIGVHQQTAYYLLFNGILGDKRPDSGNILTAKTLALLPAHPAGTGHPRVVFGEGCRLSTARLLRENITFKQLPYELKTT
jgi:adenine-specific DNA-methyltransferase